MLGASTIDVGWDQQPARWNIQVSGTVEGVGFRAFVYKLATRLKLRGFVSSQPGALAIEIEGQRASLGEFLEEFWLGAPRRARIEQLSCHSGPPQGGPKFHIVRSGTLEGFQPSRDGTPAAKPPPVPTRLGRAPRD